MSSITRNCLDCGREFQPPLHNVRKGYGFYCSRRCGKTKNLLARFWAKVLKADGCWLWTGKTDKNGYGKFWKDGREEGAHRVAYELHFGDAPADLWVLHHCDTPGCVRPEHLFLGTAQDNTDDMITKGRAVTPIVPPENRRRGDAHPARTHPGYLKHGEQNTNAKLTEADVRAIRHAHARGATLRGLAREYGVDRKAITLAVRRETWAHVA